MRRIRKKTRPDGFIALIAVLLLALGTMAFSLTVMGEAYTYSDMISRRELRIQANLNRDACFDTVTLMYAKDYFLAGDLYLNEFGCKVHVDNDLAGHASFRVEAGLSGVSSEASSSQH